MSSKMGTSLITAFMSYAKTSAADRTMRRMFSVGVDAVLVHCAGGRGA
jgi:hypothetical protein